MKLNNNLEVSMDIYHWKDKVTYARLILKWSIGSFHISSELYPLCERAKTYEPKNIPNVETRFLIFLILKGLSGARRKQVVGSEPFGMVPDIPDPKWVGQY